MRVALSAKVWITNPFYNMHPPFGKLALLLPVRCCLPAISCIWLTLGELLHMLHALAPTYHDQAIVKTWNFHSEEIFPTLHRTPLWSMQLFLGGTCNNRKEAFWKGSWIQHAFSTLMLGPTPLRRWWNGNHRLCLIRKIEKYPRHPTARPQLHLATKIKPLHYPSTQPFDADGSLMQHGNFWKMKDACPPLFFANKIFPLPTKTENLLYMKPPQQKATISGWILYSPADKTGLVLKG